MTIEITCDYCGAMFDTYAEPDTVAVECPCCGESVYLEELAEYIAAQAAEERGR